MSLDKISKIFIAFIVLIVLVNVVSNSFGTTDTGDYLGTAKGLSEHLVTKMRSTHSWAYGLLLAQPLKFIYSPILIKLLNVIWLVIIGAYIYMTRKDKRAFLIYAFSPVVWFMSPWVSPILPTAFLLLLSYDFIKKYDLTNKIIYLILSGALLGLASILWDTMMFFSVFFILCFFYKKRVSEMILFLISFSVLFSIRFIVDYALFGFPLFSLFRVFGGNLAAMLHLGSYTNISYSLWEYILLFIAVMPLFIPAFYRLVKNDFGKYKQEIFFLGLSFLLILLNPQARYLLGVAPLAIVILSKEVYSRREIRMNIILSAVLILILIYPYFGSTYDYKLTKDMDAIANDFPGKTFLAGSSENSDLYMELAMNYWGNDIKEIISWQDFELWRKNETDFQHYRIESEPKVREMRKLWFEIGLSRTDNRTFEDINYLITRDKTTELKDFELVKSYSILNVFSRAA